MALADMLALKTDGRGADAAILAAFVTDPRTEETIRALIGEQSIAPAVIRRGNCRDAIAYLKRAPSPRMIVVDLSGSEMPLSDMDEVVSICGPNVVIIAVGEENDIGLYRDLSMFGVADYVVKPITAEILRRVISIQSGGQPRSGQRQRIGKVVCVTGARGGVGATTFATSLGWMLSADAGRRAALVDLDLQCGAVSLALGVKPSAGFVEALRNPHRVDDLFLDRTMVKKTDKLMFLGAEEPLEDDTDFDPAALDAVLKILQQRFHYVVMDLPRRPGVLYRQVLERSEIQIILATPTMTALRDAMRISRLIGREDLGQRALLVVNHVTPPGRGEIPRIDFEKVIGRRVDYEIPYSRMGLAADNGGELLIRQDPVFAKIIEQIMNDLLGRSPTRETAGKRLFPFRLK